MLGIEEIGTKLRTGKGELTQVLPGDMMYFYRSASVDGEAWTFGFCRGCESLYFLDGDKRRFLTSNVISWKLDVVNFNNRKFIVEMFCSFFGYNYKEIPSTRSVRMYQFTEKMP